MKDVRKVCLFDGEVCCSWERSTGTWGGVTVVRKCDSHQGGVRKVCQLMERCDGHVGM